MAEKRRGGERVTVYLRVEDVAKLKDAGKDPAEWVRGLVKYVLAKLPEPELVEPEDEVPVEA